MVPTNIDTISHFTRMTEREKKVVTLLKQQETGVSLVLITAYTTLVGGISITYYR